MNSKLKPIGQLFSEAWSLFTKGFWKLVAVFVIPLVAFLGVAIVVVLANLSKVIALMESSGEPSINSFSELFSFLGPFIIPISILILASSIVKVWGKASILVAVRDVGKGIGIKKSLREGWGRFGSYLWVSVLLGLAVAGGLLLLIVPGIIFAVWFFFSVFALIVDDYRGVGAMKRSKALVKGCWWAVFGRAALIMLIITVLGYIPFLGMIASVLAGLFATVYFFVLYEDLKRVRQGGEGSV